MKNNQLFRIAGWCAIIVGLLMVGFHVVPSGVSGAVGLVLTLGVLLGLTVVFYALYVAHRTESAGLSLAGLVFWILALVVNLFGMVNTISTFLGVLGSFFWLLPFLIFGYLALKSSRMPRGLGVVALLAGLSLLIATVAGIMGNESIVNVVALVADVFMLAWTVWLGVVFLSKKFTAA
jgi:hypothetical protein